MTTNALAIMLEFPRLPWLHGTPWSLASGTPPWGAARSWLATHTVLVSVVGGVSVLLSLVGLALVPLVMARLPADYFLRLTLPPSPLRRRPHPARVVGRNLLGMMLVVLGVLLVPLPGPGALVVLLGLAMADFPGKRPFMAWVLRRRAIWGSIKWLRRRAGRPEMLAPGNPVLRETDALHGTNAASSA